MKPTDLVQTANVYINYMPINADYNLDYSQYRYHNPNYNSYFSSGNLQGVNIEIPIVMKSADADEIGKQFMQASIDYKNEITFNGGKRWHVIIESDVNTITEIVNQIMPGLLPVNLLEVANDKAIFEISMNEAVYYEQIKI